MSGKRRALRVLVVEDEPLLGPLSVQILKTMGEMEAELAADGSGGLALAWSWRPDVILLDLVLPGISGLELLRRYRREGGKAKVLVVTEADRNRVQKMVFALGADFLLSKPVNWEEVLGLIRLSAGGLEGLCLELLVKLGAREEGKGTRQAAECAALLGEKQCVLLKEVYIEVARRQRTTPGSVAKNIERLADELHRTGTPLYRELTKREKTDPTLTNREFLDLLAQAARIPL